MFYGKPPLSFEAAEQLLVSSGWLGDARGWEPPRVHYRTFRFDSRKRKGLWLKEALIGRELVDHPEFHNQRFVDWLKERGHPRFGVLLFASRLTYQEAADELILAALSDMGGEWPFRTNTLPPQIELIIGTMQPEAAAKLPATLRPRR